MKYIDAEKLKRLVGELKGRAKRNRCDSWGIVPDALEEVEGFIDSLQQEQPKGLHFTPLNRLIQKIPSKNWNETVNNYAKKLRDCLIKEGYLKDAEILQGYISYMNGNNVPMATMDEQEHPKVDLDKEIKNYLATKCAGDDEPSVSEIARHFFELGLSAGMEKINGVDGVVHHALKSHWIVTDKNKLAAILKAFPEGAEGELFICA